MVSKIELPPHALPAQRLVRAAFGGEFVAESKNALLVRESGREIDYYFPEADVRQDLLVSDEAKVTEDRGMMKNWSVKIGERTAEKAAWSYTDLPDGRPDLRGYIAFRWRAMDHWYEEAEEVFAHPRDPYHRVDTLKSSRHIQVVVNGQTVAETERPYVLLETGVIPRYYIHPEDVRMDLLTPTEKHTRCPYKGEASYWTLKVGETVYPDIVWSYLDPLPECPKIKGLLAFYNEKVEIYVDGEREGEPQKVTS